MRSCKTDHQASDSDNGSAKDDAVSTASSEHKDEEARDREGSKKDGAKEPRVKKFIAFKKDKRNPSRFEGEGISFKAKLIGIVDVSDIRGDKMCQESLVKLKKMMKNSGQHKQKIILSISMEGIKIKEEKSGDLIHHHPVHKISFISQDISDTRAFGYVFGSPDDFHQFIGIKTEKAASQVVIALRDLFQLFLDMKKKEMSEAQQLHQQQNHLAESLGRNPSTIKEIKAVDQDQVPMPAHPPPPPPLLQDTAAIGDLLGLQFEMDNLQLGIQQMEDSIAVATSVNPEMSSQTRDPFATPDHLAPMTMEPLLPHINPSSTSVLQNGPQLLADLPPQFPGKISENDTRNDDRLAGPSATVAGDRYAAFANIDDAPSLFDNPTVSTFSELPSHQKEWPADPEGPTTFNICGGKENEIPRLPLSPPRSPSKANPSVLSERDLPRKCGSPANKKDFCELQSPPKKLTRDFMADLSDGCPSTFPVTLECNIDAGNTLGNVGTDEPVLPLTICLVPPEASVCSTMHVESDDSWAKLWDTVEGGNLRVPVNPFNPFRKMACTKRGTPSTSPPLPAPRLPVRTSEPAFPTSSPPPRPPNRNCLTPTPPLPRKKGNLEKTWLSFLSGYTNSGIASQLGHDGEQSHVSGASPPIPIPARKHLPPVPPGARPGSSNANGIVDGASNLAKRLDFLDTTLSHLDFSDQSCLDDRRVHSGHPSFSTSTLLDAGNREGTLPFASANPKLSNPFFTNSPSDDGSHANRVRDCQAKPPNPFSSPPLPPRSFGPNSASPSPINSPQKIFTSSNMAHSVGNSPTHRPTSHSVGPRSAPPSRPLDAAAGRPCILPRTAPNGCEDVSARAPESRQRPQSPVSPEERNIFRRKSDPFADDFFRGVQETSKAAAAQTKLGSHDAAGKGSG